MFTFFLHPKPLNYNGTGLPFPTTGLPQPLTTKWRTCTVVRCNSLIVRNSSFVSVRGGSSLWKVEQMKICALHDVITNAKVGN